MNITAAVAGTGFIGPVHVEALKRIGVRVKGILGSTHEKSAQAASSLNLEKGYTSFQEILEDSEVQAVHLAVPNVLHYDMTKQALAAGKHVMCEKPLAMTSTESEELVRLAEESGLVAGVCYNIRFYPMNLQLRQWIAEGKAGELHFISGSYVQDWLLYDTDYNWRVLADKGGELRAVADIGTHWMDLISSISGLEIRAVMADLHTVHPVRKRPKGEVKTFSNEELTEDQLEKVAIHTEDCGTIMCRFSNGAKGVLYVSQVQAGKKNCLRYEISGSKAAYSWNSEQPNELEIGHRHKPNERFVRDPSLLSSLPAAYTNYPGGHNEGFPDTFKQCFKAFYQAIQNNTPAKDALYPTFLEGHHEILLCEAILASHRQERWITV
ncbi:MAG: Gfo/Idh/MocA family oxidoreductase [Bacteroidota bacterium]